MTTFEEELGRINGLLGDEVSRPVKDAHGWSFGERVRVIEDDENAGVFENDEGWIVLESVGAAEYGNVRTAFMILLDGSDCPIEIPFDIIEGV